jgi:ribokinase
LAFVGSDQNGKDCMKVLKDNGVKTDYVQVEQGKLSNYHYVLWYGADRTILVKHQHYTYTLPKNLEAPRWIYLSSLGANTEHYHHEIESFLKNNPETKLAFQPGTFQMNLPYEQFHYLYERSEIFIVNVEEAQRILKTKETDHLTLLEMLHEKGPYIVVMTDGPKGAYVYTEGQAWYMPIYPDPKPPYERTGAGDAFASTFVAALALGKSIEEAMTWAPINSMSVVQYVGAQKGLLMKNNLLELLAKAPRDYKPKKLQ